MESFWTGMCTFQTLRQCEFYVATGLVPAEVEVGVVFLEIFQDEFEPASQGHKQGDCLDGLPSHFSNNVRALLAFENSMMHI